MTQVKEWFGTVRDEGIEKEVWVLTPGINRSYEVILEPTKKGKTTKAYREIKVKLGDDWFSDISDCWADQNRLPFSVQYAISKHLGFSQ